ncbi:hypothetical protein OBP_175 [Pseudomonas phage OBP]|uniref:hypothetical protein n=1 Tax=Pseudomonas phage OBP TaxID=1124849 RepID=UPI000240D58F|nr:hypothetical protein OBP_175 [Pseudomonas phage OBP]AEV89612.1 hypothetical protein OBP_175 [Pseudomonas phage OBP]
MKDTINTLTHAALLAVGKKMREQGISGGLISDIHFSHLRRQQPIFDQPRGIDLPTNDGFQEKRNRQVRQGKKSAWPVPRGKGHRY